MSAPERGEVWWWESQKIGRRPVVVLSRDEAISRRRRAIVAPCTTTRRGLPTEVSLDPGTDPVPVSCVVNLDSADDVSTALLVERLGRLSSARMGEVCQALSIAVDC
jgi:mRNA interferase MazF